MRKYLSSFLWWGIDLVLLSVSLYAAFWIRFDGAIPSLWWNRLPFYWVLSWVFKSVWLWYFDLYRILWKQVSVRELLRVFWAVALGQMLLGVFYFMVRQDVVPWPYYTPLPRSVWLLDGILSFLLIGMARSGHRMFTAVWSDLKHGSKQKRLLLIGAGDAGSQILRLLQTEYPTWYHIVGFLDDDPSKQHLWIHGVRVLGPRRQLPQVAMRQRVDEVWITMPSASATKIQETIQLARQAGIKYIRVLPSLSALLKGKLDITDVRTIRLEDVLGREPVSINVHQVKDVLKGKTVLVTGAAGSIGSELCRQILAFQPALLCAVDQDESGLFQLELELRDLIPPGTQFQLVVADICDATRIRNLFHHVSPQVVFHAAAYKHVPLMEEHPQEAVKTNILGTRIVAQAALEAESERFVLISTDKAVYPTSVMGATKRVAEMLVQTLQRQARRQGKRTRFMAVRFGNVLGSRGSVFPVFQTQIQKGGPVTVTHPEMRRYFMLPTEAALLVLQAGAMGQGGEVFLLDMGDPVRILDLAKEMIRLAGYEPDVDIPIVFTGLRPGEKLSETLLTAEEEAQVTQHERVWVIPNRGPSDEEHFLDQVEQLIAAAQADRFEELRPRLQALVPTYTPNATLTETRGGKP